MTPEELLQALLDSRGGPATDPIHNRGHPTRIRILRALRENGLPISTLAEQMAVTRQTAYRALDVSLEGGLVKQEDSEYVLSCSGAAVLRAYERIITQVDIDAFTRLTRSRHQRWILDSLRSAPARKATLATKTPSENGPSRSTIHRIIDRFQKGGYVVETNGLHRVTATGLQLLETYEGFLTTVEQALDKQAFLRWLPAEFESFPIDALDGATTIRNSPKQPHDVLTAFVRVADPDLETLQAISTIVSPTLTEAYLPVLGGDTEVVAVFPDDVLFKLHQEPEFIEFVKQRDFQSYISEGRATRDGELLFVPDSLALHLVICDGSRVVLAPSPATGVTEVEAAAIDSTDPRIIEWASTFFEIYHTRGRPPLRTFLERAQRAHPSTRRKAHD